MPGISRVFGCKTHAELVESEKATMKHLTAVVIINVFTCFELLCTYTLCSVHHCLLSNI